MLVSNKPSARTGHCDIEQTNPGLLTSIRKCRRGTSPHYNVRAEQRCVEGFANCCWLFCTGMQTCHANRPKLKGLLSGKRHENNSTRPASIKTIVWDQAWNERTTRANPDLLIPGHLSPKKRMLLCPGPKTRLTLVATDLKQGSAKAWIAVSISKMQKTIR